MADQIWLKRVLIPLWAIQILFCLILIATTCAAIATVNYNSGIPGTSLYSEAQAFTAEGFTSVGVLALIVIMTIVEIILMARLRLRPITNIVLQSIKTLIWTAFFIITIVGVMRTSDRLGILIPFIILLTQVGLLIYGAVVLHRHRKGTLYRGQYSRAEAGVAGPLGYNAGYNAPPFENPAAGASYEGASSTMAGNPFRDTSRDPSPAPTIVPELPQQHSYSSYRPYQSTQPYDQAYEMSTHPVAQPVGVQELGA